MFKNYLLHDIITLVNKMIMSICDNADTLSVIRIIKIIITIIKIGVPIVLIASVMLDYAKNVHDGEYEKTLPKAVKKGVAAVLVFFVPTFVSIIMNLIWSNSDLTVCLNNATPEGILQARINYSEKLISNFENNFTTANYYAAKESIKKIDDSAQKEILSEKIESYEKYIDLQKEFIPDHEWDKIY